jgi:PAS domain S-box-containing protein
MGESSAARGWVSEHLRGSERWYRSLIENASEPITVIDADGVITYASPAFEHCLGYSVAEMVGMNALSLLHPDDAPVVARALAERLARPGDRTVARQRLRHRDGSWRTFRFSSWSLLHDPAVRGIVVNARDITEEQALKAQLAHSRKMEAVGQLAGGIAHDFNSLLTAILSSTDLILGEVPDGPVRHDAETIRRAAERAAALTRQLLTFSRKQMVEPRLLDINALVSATARMLARALGERTSLTLDLTPDIGAVYADPNQLEQVLVNLAVNARDAMADGGTVGIRTAELDGRVMLQVIDSGIGMDLELQNRIFEPFFTTKEIGKGTGLGLATVYGIVKQCGGEVVVESAPGAGSVFTVLLPRREEPAHAAVLPASSDRPVGNETVLVVEDEPVVRETIRRVLTRHGYLVREALNGRDALSVLDASNDAVDLIMTDVMMPELNGHQLVAALAERGAGIPVLVMSGYDDGSAAGCDALPHGTRFLGKPFTIEDLLRVIREMLDGATV